MGTMVVDNKLPRQRSGVCFLDKLEEGAGERNGESGNGDGDKNEKQRAAEEVERTADFVNQGEVDGGNDGGREGGEEWFC